MPLPAITPLAAMGIGAGISALGGLFQMGRAARERRRWRRMIENYERQDLTNLANDIQINTNVSDMLRRNVAADQAAMGDRLQQAGQRAIIGGAGNLGRQSVMANQQALADLNRQQTQRQYAVLNEGQRLRQMQENRELQDLGGMGAMYNAANQDMNMGLMNVARAGMNFATNMAYLGNQPGVQTPQVETVNTGVPTMGPQFLGASSLPMQGVSSMGPQFANATYLPPPQANMLPQMSSYGPQFANMAQLGAMPLYPG